MKNFFAKLKAKAVAKVAAASGVLVAGMGVASNAAESTSAPISFADGMSNFGSFVGGIIAAWVTVVFAILTPEMWILMLPVYAYIFVVATASLRSFYKG